MKVYNYRATGERRFYLNLIVFLLALGLLPVSLISQEAFAAIEARKAPESTPEIVQDASALNTLSEITSDSLATSYTPSAATARVVTSTPVVKIADQISIGGKTLSIFHSSDTLIDSGTKVGLYGKYFLYGHNSSSVFGNLKNLAVGTRFTITLDGATKTYQIVGSDVLNYTDSSRADYAQKFMYSMTASGSYKGQKYDYIIMTCHGTNLGNGNATERLVVFANEVK